MNTKRVNFFDSFFTQLKNSILSFEKYPELLNNKLSKSLIFGIIMLNLSLLVNGVIPVFVNYTKAGGFDNFIINNIPEFEVQDNRLVIDEYNIKILPNNVALIFDPLDEKRITNSDIKSTELDDNSIFIKVTPSYFMSENILGIGTAVNLDLYLEALQIKNRDDLLMLKQPFLISLALSFVFAMNLYIIIILFMILMSSIWINFFSIFYNIKLPLKELIKFTIYINTAPLTIKIYLGVLNLLFSTITLTMPSIVYFGLGVTYTHFIFKYFQQKKLYTMSRIDIKI
ncbi:MAG: DUF1189 family protein [bacterium]